MRYRVKKKIKPTQPKYHCAFARCHESETWTTHKKGIHTQLKYRKTSGNLQTGVKQTEAHAYSLQAKCNGMVALQLVHPLGLFGKTFLKEVAYLEENGNVFMTPENMKSSVLAKAEHVGIETNHKVQYRL